jgi:RNA 2',3'-cyclic 3'-phosphodiesterase
LDNNNIRTFISVDVTNNDAIQELQHKLSFHAKWNSLKIKPVEKQNLHFSIIFLGQIDLETVNKIKCRLSGLQFEPIRIIYTGLGVFPSHDFARIIWIGTDEEGRKKLIGLAEKVISSIRDIGFIPDKPFTPHVTLFRLKAGKLRIGNMLSEYNDMTFGSDVIDKIHLKRSELTTSGPIYSDLFTVYAI